MAYRESVLDGRKRASEKQRSRDNDMKRLERGVIAPMELARENGFFASLNAPKMRIIAVGKKKFA